MKNIFSPTEQKVIKAIGRKRAINTKEIAEVVYADIDRPTNYRMVISNCVNRIMVKCKKHKLKWTLQSWNFGYKGKLVGYIQSKYTI